MQVLGSQFGFWGGALGGEGGSGTGSSSAGGGAAGSEAGENSEEGEGRLGRRLEVGGGQIAAIVSVAAGLFFSAYSLQQVRDEDAAGRESSERAQASQVGMWVGSLGGAVFVSNRSADPAYNVWLRLRPLGGGAHASSGYFDLGTLPPCMRVQLPVDKLLKAMPRGAASVAGAQRTRERLATGAARADVEISFKDAAGKPWTRSLDSLRSGGYWNTGHGKGHVRATFGKKSVFFEDTDLDDIKGCGQSPTGR